MGGKFWSRLMQACFLPSRTGAAWTVWGKKRHALLNQAVIESLEPRQLLTALYYDASALPGLQAGNGSWNATSTCWNTKADGSGLRTAWIDGADAYFLTSGASSISLTGAINVHSLKVSASGYTLSGGTLNFTDATSGITTDQDVTIKSSLAGGWTKSGQAMLTLTSSSGRSQVDAGTLRLSSVNAWASDITN